ncbi:hypothetical protein PZH32_07165 [Adlercreutzia equolifaciens]|uniref:restriction endonuclease subunit S n=1 Tax=Adlercreutzia equolifaciens TaxID=446660 RepID=UPI0023B19E66|nr:hypothetical protein [Adlercreutzia equolifaciens]MDE8702742.1 hypothetical protein [Adlercreutzia equolifaciens]
MAQPVYPRAALHSRQRATAWEQRKLGEVAQHLQYGVGASAVPYDGEIKYLRITDIDDETHEFLNEDLTSPDPEFCIGDDSYLQKGDIVFARTGASVGKTYLNRDDDGGIVYAGFLIRARLSQDADPEFVYQQTLTEPYAKFVEITSQRSGQPGINAIEYGEWELAWCSWKEQRLIGSFFQRLDSLITLHQRE